MSHYLGNTLSQHLGDSFRFATPGQTFCDIVASPRVFFWLFTSSPCQSVIASLVIVFFTSNNQSVFQLKSVTSSLMHPRPNPTLGCHPNTETKCYLYCEIGPPLAPPGRPIAKNRLIFAPFSSAHLASEARAVTRKMRATCRSKLARCELQYPISDGRLVCKYLIINDLSDSRSCGMESAK